MTLKLMMWPQRGSILL